MYVVEQRIEVRNGWRRVFQTREQVIAAITKEPPTAECACLNDGTTDVEVEMRYHVEMIAEGRIKAAMIKDFDQDDDDVALAKSVGDVLAKAFDPQPVDVVKS
jgi:hypothetical protein